MKWTPNQKESVLPPASTKIHVVCVPAVENKVFSAEVDMINIQEGSDISSGTLDLETSELERQIKQVPKIMEFRKPALLPSNRKPAFIWDHRMLVEEIVVEGVTEQRKGRYYMYKCTDPSLGLPANRLFVEQYGCSVYGDAFFFMLKESKPDGLSPGKMDWQIDWYVTRFFFAPLAKKRDPTHTA